MCVCPQCKRLEGGMAKLAEASVQLNELNEKLAVQKVVLAEKNAACETLLAEITARTSQATEKKEFAVAKGQDIEEQSKVIKVEKVCVLSFVVGTQSNMPC